MAGKEMSDMSDSLESDSTLGQDDSELALSGIKMLLNNGFEEAQALFDKYKYAPFFSSMNIQTCVIKITTGAMISETFVKLHVYCKCSNAIVLVFC